MNARLRMMVESRELEEAAAEDVEVLGTWRRAVQSLRDATIPGLSAESAYTLAYQAGLQGATAVLRAAGYRVRETPRGHHRLTFLGLAALQLPGLSEMGRRLNETRLGRHEAVYGWEESVGPERLRELLSVVEPLLSTAFEHLRSTRPEIAEDLPAPG